MRPCMHVATLKITLTLLLTCNASIRIVSYCKKRLDFVCDNGARMRHPQWAENSFLHLVLPCRAVNYLKRASEQCESQVGVGRLQTRWQHQLRSGQSLVDFIVCVLATRDEYAGARRLSGKSGHVAGQLLERDASTGLEVAFNWKACVVRSNITVNGFDQTLITHLKHHQRGKQLCNGAHAEGSVTRWRPKSGICNKEMRLIAM